MLRATLSKIDQERGREVEVGGGESRWRQEYSAARRVSESNRDVIASAPGQSFISYARRIIIRGQRGYKFPPFKFQIRFFLGNLGGARSLGLHSEPLVALIGTADRFGMECSTYFLSFARKNSSPTPVPLPPRAFLPLALSPRTARANLNDVAQFTSR